LNTVPALADYYVAAEFLLSRNDGRFDTTECQYHIGASIAPGGYAWVFPKGSTPPTSAWSFPPTGRRAEREIVPRRIRRTAIPGAGILAEMAGGIPVTGALKRMTADGLAAVGDAAHQADPLHGGGINLG